MSKGLCSRIAIASITLTGIVMIASAHAWAASYTLIGDSGQALSSVFEGLKPNPALRPDQLAKYQPLRRPWRGIVSNQLPGLLQVHFAEGSCPVSSCSGNFTAFTPQLGGCNASSCTNLDDFFTDVKNAPCDSGEFDYECGDGIVCCANAFRCVNSRGCPSN
jgi:hypothetical protein